MSSIKFLKQLVFSFAFLVIQVFLLLVAVFHYNKFLALGFLPFLIGTCYYWWQNYQRKRQDLVQCLKIVTRKWDEKKNRA